MAERQTQSARLDRIETKIDKLADAMVSLARTEEKILSMEKETRNHFDRMNRFSEKLDNVERKVNENAQIVGVINRIAWVATTAIIAAIIKYFWM